ncbi:MAG: 30S ribosomal protein S4 [Candidatus Pacebacteria bacterium]|nr:30S ribosomal protein S4 [Candidatus Paceibacterota bacterium]
MKIGPKYKIARRLGPAVFEKTQTQKFALSEARHAAGKRKDKRGKALSDFGLQLIEKQRVRFSYGITERQLSNYVNKSIDTKGGNPAEKLFASLESRLDNVVYRLGIAHTRRLARQMVSHGHFVVNGKRTKVPSHTVSIGDVITAREGSKKSVLFANLPKKLENYSVPKWLKFDAENIKATVEGTPVLESGSAINLNAVFEFYSR